VGAVEAALSSNPPSSASFADAGTELILRDTPWYRLKVNFLDQNF
jgi:hypothetical protein